MDGGGGRLFKNELIFLGYRKCGWISSSYWERVGVRLFPSFLITKFNGFCRHA